ncbi:50S ribosomal protein L32 [Candidatus Microgenomates bacterium]|nr:50S ribosomal protein L32 [Candidatus Microgenomates bacterium]
MSAVPKRRHSTRRQGKRRASIKLNLPNLAPCPKCKELKLPHVVCPKCGEYK